MYIFWKRRFETGIRKYKYIKKYASLSISTALMLILAQIIRVKFFPERKRKKDVYLWHNKCETSMCVIRVRQSQCSRRIGTLNSSLSPPLRSRCMRSFVFFSRSHIRNHINIEIKENRTEQLQLIILDLAPNGVTHINRTRKSTILNRS